MLIRYTPTTELSTPTITIASNDLTVPNYQFALRGRRQHPGRGFGQTQLGRQLQQYSRRRDDAIYFSPRARSLS
ncbi:MAG: hypothetical protein R3F11_07105 [Verrucomicrobiales bacterium]